MIRLTPRVVGQPDFNDPYFFEQYGDRPLGTPSSFDDEFDLNALDAKWAWRNQGSSTATVANGRLNLSAAPGSGDQWRILEQTIGVSTWDIRVKMLPILNRAANNKTGLVVANNSSGKLIIIELLYEGAGMGIRWGKWNNNTGFAGQISSIDVQASGDWYLRMTCNGTSMVPYVSRDGIVWNTVGNGPTETLSNFIGSVDRIGFGVDNANSGNAMSGDIDWFRVIL